MTYYYSFFISQNLNEYIVWSVGKTIAVLNTVSIKIYFIFDERKALANHYFVQKILELKRFYKRKPQTLSNVN